MRTMTPAQLNPAAYPDTPRATTRANTSLPPPSPTPAGAGGGAVLSYPPPPWTVQPSYMPAPAAAGAPYRAPHVTSSMEQFEYLREEVDPTAKTHFMKKNAMTEYLRAAISKHVNLKSTGH